MSKHFDMPARTQIIFKMYSHIYFVSENITLAALRQTDIFGIYSQRAVPLLLVWSHKPPRNYHDFSITLLFLTHKPPRKVLVSHIATTYHHISLLLPSSYRSSGQLQEMSMSWVTDLYSITQILLLHCFIILMLLILLMYNSGVIN